MRETGETITNMQLTPMMFTLFLSLQNELLSQQIRYLFEEETVGFIESIQVFAVDIEYSEELIYI